MTDPFTRADALAQLAELDHGRTRCRECYAVDPPVDARGHHLGCPVQMRDRDRDPRMERDAVRLLDIERTRDAMREFVRLHTEHARARDGMARFLFLALGAEAVSEGDAAGFLGIDRIAVRDLALRGAELDAITREARVERARARLRALREPEALPEPTSFGWGLW